MIWADSLKNVNTYKEAFEYFLNERGCSRYDGLGGDVSHCPLCKVADNNCAKCPLATTTVKPWACRTCLDLEDIIDVPRRKEIVSALLAELPENSWDDLIKIRKKIRLLLTKEEKYETSYKI